MMTTTNPSTLSEFRGNRASQAAVAAAAGVNHADLSRFERGHLNASPEWIDRVVAAYASECSASEAEVRSLLPERYREPAEREAVAS
jgi:hypothetical protein